MHALLHMPSSQHPTGSKHPLQRPGRLQRQHMGPETQTMNNQQGKQREEGILAYTYIYTYHPHNIQQAGNTPCRGPDTYNVNVWGAETQTTNNQQGK